MNVLPSSATLGSFIGVLVLVLLLTLALAFKLRAIFAMLHRSQQRLYDLMLTVMRQKSTDTSKKWESFIPLTLPSLFPLEQVLQQERYNNRSGLHLMLHLLWHFLLALPKRELAYGLTLLRRPNAPFYVEVKFSVRKLIGDLLRFAFLPLWLMIAILGFCAKIIVQCLFSTSGQ